MQPSDKIQAFETKLLELHAENESIQARADSEGRELSGTEIASIDRNSAEFAGIRARLTVEKDGAALAAPAPTYTSPTPLPGVVASSQTRLPAYRGATGSAGAGDFKAFAEFARTGRIQAATSMTVGTTADGGALVPTLVSDQIREVQAQQGAIRGLAQVMQLPQAVQVPIATTLPGAAWVGESDSRANQTVPVLATTTLPGGALSSVVSMTTFLVNDSSWSLESYIIGAMGRQFGLTESNAFLNGTGTSNQVKGILAYTQAATADASRAWGTVEKLHTGTSAGGVTPDFILDLSIRLNPAYRKNAVVIMAPSTYSTLLKVKASTAGSYLLDGAASASGLPSIWGMPVHLDPFVPVIAASSASVIVGDIRAAYTIQDIGAQTILRDPYTVKGSVLWWSERRLVAGLVDSNAVKIGVCAV